MAGRRRVADDPIREFFQPPLRDCELDYPEDDWDDLDDSFAWSDATYDGVRLTLTRQPRDYR